MSNHWIKTAIKHHGQLHRDLGVPQGQEIPHEKIVEAAKRKDVVGDRARMALTLRALHKHDSDGDGDGDES